MPAEFVVNEKRQVEKPRWLRKKERMKTLKRKKSEKPKISQLRLNSPSLSCHGVVRRRIVGVVLFEPITDSTLNAPCLHFLVKNTARHVLSMLKLLSEGIPPCGTVEQRLAAPPLEYRDPKGKKASLYTAYMKKNNLSPEMVMEEAAKFGLTVPEEQLNTVSYWTRTPQKIHYC